MILYRIKLHPNVQKFLRKCSVFLAERIQNRLRILKRDPFHYLEHYEGANYYKFRIGSYRALIDIDTKRKIIWIQVLDHRKKIYKRK